MADVTEETGAPATKITEEMKSLRKSCDMLNIDWNHRNNVKKLQSLIAAWNEQEHTSLEPQQEPKLEPRSERMTATEFVDRQEQPRPTWEPESVSTNTDENVSVPRKRREIPQDVKDGLLYMRSYSKARSEVIESFIQSIL